MKTVTLIVDGMKVQGELLVVSAPNITIHFDVNIIKYQDGTRTLYSIFSNKRGNAYDAHDCRTLSQLSEEMRKLV
jgi:hypothetical protein